MSGFWGTVGSIQTWGVSLEEEGGYGVFICEQNLGRFLEELRRSE